MNSSDRSFDSNNSDMSSLWARKCERYCCMGVTYFPLFFVYSLTTWAVWVEFQIGSISTESNWIGNWTSCLGIILYLLLNWSYTTAVFTNPGSTTSKNGYSSLPTQAPSVGTNFTVKANGELRYCKKCQTRKPDRAHHCSTCRVCILKMDHHCPWLATCVGLRNYKSFLLFLGYTTLFCFLCFGVSGFWVWNEILSEREYSKSLMPINFVILAVISSIIGIILAGFTGWHIVLASRGQTTIECLEKTRYLSARKYRLNSHFSSSAYTQPSDTFHADACRSTQSMCELESSRVQHSERISFRDYNQARSRVQYEKYLDEDDSAKLPSAFDLGWKMNLLHLFGHNKLLWLIPIATTTGDGWNWDPNPKWLQAKKRILLERKEQRQREHAAGWGYEYSSTNSENLNDMTISDPEYSAVEESLESNDPLTRTTKKADRILGRKQEFTDGILLDSLRPRNHNNLNQTSESVDRQETRVLDRKVSLGWPQKVGVFTKILNDKDLKRDDIKEWDGRDEGVEEVD